MAKKKPAPKKKGDECVVSPEEWDLLPCTAKQTLHELYPKQCPEALCSVPA